MKKHNIQENYERLFGPIKEDWWSDMSSGEQAQYIKDHPNSKKAKNAKKAKDEPKDEPSDAVDAYEIMDNPDYVLTVLDEFEDEGMDVDDIRDRVDAMKDLDGEEYEDEAFALADELKDMKKAL